MIKIKWKGRMEGESEREGRMEMGGYVSESGNVSESGMEMGWCGICVWK